MRRLEMNPLNAAPREETPKFWAMVKALEFVFNLEENYKSNIHIRWTLHTWGRSADHFPSIHNPHRRPRKQLLLLLFSFYGWGNWNWERINNLFTVIQLGKGEVKAWTQIPWGPKFILSFPAALQVKLPQTITSRTRWLKKRRKRTSWNLMIMFGASRCLLHSFIQQINWSAYFAWNRAWSIERRAKQAQPLPSWTESLIRNMDIKHWSVLRRRATGSQFSFRRDLWLHWELDMTSIKHQVQMSYNNNYLRKSTPLFPT